TPGGDVYLAQERFTEGLIVSAEKVGTNDSLRRDYLTRVERNVRMPIYWILDQKAKVASCLEMREKVTELIDDVGLDYFKLTTREFILAWRCAQLSQVQDVMVAGRYRGQNFYGHITERNQVILPLSENANLLSFNPFELDVTSDE